MADALKAVLDNRLHQNERVAAGEPLREIALSYAVDHSTIT
jgi:hypothetical protein